MSKKKITAIVLFIFLSLFIFTFANPSDGLEPIAGEGNDGLDTNDDSNNQEGTELLQNNNQQAANVFAGQLPNFNFGNLETGNTVGNDSNNNGNIPEEVSSLAVAFKYNNKDNAKVWYKNNVKVKYEVVENSNLVISSVNFCKTTNVDCVPTKTTTDLAATKKLKENNQANKLCLQAEYTNGTSSKVFCSETVNIDKTNPTITVDPIVVDINGTLDLRDGVVFTDNNSGIDTSYGQNGLKVNKTVNGTKLDLTTAGDYEVKYTTYDNAGNKTTVKRLVTVVAPAPTVEFSVSGNENKIFNKNGWANENVKLNVVITDNSNTGISESLYCTNGKVKDCTPKKDLVTNTVKMTENSSTNKVCVKVTDNVGETTEVCSNSYKIDKKDPNITVPATAKTTFDIYTTIEAINKSLLAEVITTDSLSGINANSLTVDASNVNVNKAGTYEVEFTVRDNAGNKTTKKLDITIDAPAPTVTFSDKFNVINNGWSTTVPTIIEFDVKDYSNTGIKSVTYCKANSGNTINTNLTCVPNIDVKTTPRKVSFNAEVKNQALCVKVVDNNGKDTTTCSSETLNFGIDATNPEISGITNNEVTNQAVNINVKEINLSSISITKDNLVITKNVDLTKINNKLEFTEEGNYIITATDQAGNTTTLNFIIDKTAPSIVNEKNNGIIDLYNKNHINLVITDSNLDRVVYTLNGGEEKTATPIINGSNKYQFGDVTRGEGDYVVTAYDKAGNSKTVSFTVDKTAPSIVNEKNNGVIDLYNKNHINLVITDSNLDRVVYTLNGGEEKTATPIINGSNKYQFGDVTRGEGNYVVTAYDKAGNSKTVSFTVDKTAPIINGVTNGGMYNTTPTITIYEINLDTVVITKNGNPYTKGIDSIKYDGVYIITVTDKAGNTTTVKFTIDKTKPEIINSENNGVINEYNKKQINLLITDEYLDKVEYTVNGGEVKIVNPINAGSSKYQFGDNTRGEGRYVVTAYDKAGNTTTVSFIVDKTAPVITDSNSSSTINVMISDEIKVLEGITATDALSGIKSFIPTGNDVVEINGEYYLKPNTIGRSIVVYTAIDNAGNTKTYERIYNVDDVTPTFTLSTDAKLNSNGWAKADIGVTINTAETDYTKKTCLTTGNSCTPTTDNGLQITNESTSSKMCVTITNKYGKESAPVCTDSYKLDKTAPNPGKLVIKGTMNNNTVTVPASCPEGYQESTGLDIAKGECRSINAIDVNYGEYVYDYTNKNPETTVLEPTGWYISNVVYYATGANDPLSGYSGITYNHKNNTVIADGDNIMVRAYVTDKAYNSSYLTEYIKRDTVAPTIGEGINTEGSEFYKTQEVLISTFYGNLFDATSGVKELNITGDVVLKDDVYYLDTSTLGNKSITLELIDNAGHKTTKTINSNVEEKNLQLNLTSADNNDWTNQDIPVKIEITDEAAIGVKSIKYCETSEEKCTPTTLVENTDTVMITEESATSKVCVLVTDNLNREITSCSKEYKLDKTAPESAKIVLTGTMNNKTVTTPATCPSGYQESTGLELLQGECRSIKSTGNHWILGPTYDYTNKIKETTSTEPTGWYISDVGISVTGATDTLSGYNGFTTNHTNNTVTVDGDNIIVKATIKDNVGNTRELTETIKRDTVAPTAALDVEGTLGENDWYTSSDSSLGLFFEPSGDDETSGIASAEIISKPNTVLSTGKKNYIQTVIGGTYDIKVKVTDNAGHTAEKTVTLKYDGTAPTVNLGGVIGNLLGTDGWTNKDFTLTNLDTTNLTGDVYDLESGIQSVSIDPTTVTEEGITDVKVTAKNNAGLTTEEIIQVKIDKTAPTFTGIKDTSIMVGDNFNLKDGVTVNDNLSGISSVVTAIEKDGYFAFVGDINTITNLDFNNILTSLSTAVTTIDTTKAGVHTVVYATMDKAGNFAFETRKVTVKFDAPTLALDFNLKDTTKPLAIDNFNFNLGLTDSTDKQLENLKFCMPGQPACRLNIEVNSNYIDTVLDDYVPDEYQSLVPGINSLYGVAEATNEDICLTVYTGIAGLEITECVGYNPVADSYNDGVAAIEELERKINERLQAEIQKIMDAKDKAEAELNKKIEEHNQAISELRTKLQVEKDKLVSAAEDAKETIETEIAKIEAEIKRIEDLINSLK